MAYTLEQLEQEQLRRQKGRAGMLSTGKVAEVAPVRVSPKPAGPYGLDELLAEQARRKGVAAKEKPGALGLFGRGFKGELALGYGAGEPPPLETTGEKVAYGAGSLAGMLPSFAAMSLVTSPIVGGALKVGRLGRLMKALHTVGKVSQMVDKAGKARQVSKIGMVVEGAIQSGTLFAAHGAAHKLPPGEEGLAPRLKAGVKAFPMGAAFGATAPIVSGRLAHMGVAGAIGAGATAVEGGSTEDILIQGGLLSAMAGLHIGVRDARRYVKQVAGEIDKLPGDQKQVKVDEILDPIRESARGRQKGLEQEWAAGEEAYRRTPEGKQEIIDKTFATPMSTTETTDLAMRTMGDWREQRAGAMAGMFPGAVAERRARPQVAGPGLVIGPEDIARRPEMVTAEGRVISDVRLEEQIREAIAKPEFLRTAEEQLLLQEFGRTEGAIEPAPGVPLGLRAFGIQPSGDVLRAFRRPGDVELQREEAYQTPTAPREPDVFTGRRVGKKGPYVGLEPKRYTPEEAQAAIDEMTGVRRRAKREPADLITEADKRRQQVIDEEAGERADLALRVEDEVKQHVDAAQLAEKHGKPDIAEQEAQIAKKNAEAVKLADGPEIEKAVEDLVAQLPKEKAKLAEVKVEGKPTADLTKVALTDMIEAIKAGEKGGYKGRDAEGKAVFEKSGYPDWYRKLSKEFNIGQKYFLNVMEKAARLKATDTATARQKLTKKQFEVYFKALQTAKEMSTKGEYAKFADIDAEFQAAEAKGFEYYGPETKIEVGTLKPGDKFLKEGEEYTHKGFDKEGRAILENDVTLKKDPFDTVELEAIKKKGPAVVLEAKPQVFRMTEATKVTSTQGKEVTLPKGEEYMAYPAGEGKVKLQDGKQVTVYEGELAKLKGQMLPEGEEPMAGGVGPKETKAQKNMRKALEALGVQPKRKPGEPLPKRARSVGLEYQKISVEAKELETELGFEYPKKPVPHEEVERAANRIMESDEQLLKVLTKNIGKAKLTDPEVLVIRRMNATALESFVDTFREGSIDEINTRLQKYQEGLGKKTQDLHSERGRALNALKIQVQASPEAISRAFANLKRALRPEDIDRFQAAQEALQFGDTKPMVNFIKHLEATSENPKVMDYVYEYWYNSILSGVPTHMVNVGSNTAWMAWQTAVHRPLLAAVDAVVARFQGRKAEYYIDEVVPMLAGIRKGFKPGAKAAGEMIKKGYTTDAQMDKWALDMGKTIGAFSRSPNKYLRAVAPFVTFPSRALRAMDVWAKQIAYDAEINATAKRMEKQGKGKYEDLVQNPTEEMMEAAIQFGEYSTFMNSPGDITKWILAGREKIPGARLVIPFVNTIANLVKRGVEMTPGVGAMKFLGGKVKGPQVTQVLVKQIEGAIMATAIVSMFLDEDRITGDVPKDRAARDRFYAQGKKPWAVKIGDRWVQYRRIEPFNTPIAAIAIVHDKWKQTGEEPSTELAFRIAGSFVDNVLDSSYLSGLTQVLDSVRSADRVPQKLNNMVDRTIASFSPMSSFQRSFVRAFEAMEGEGATVRKPRGTLETLMGVTPGLSERVPARKDIWGQEVTIPGSPIEQWLPWKSAKATEDVVEKEIERLHETGLLSYPGMPAKYVSIRGERVDFTDEQYDKYITKSGQAAKKRLDRLVGTRYWKMLSDKEQADRIQRVIRDARKKVRSRLKRELSRGLIPGVIRSRRTQKTRETNLGGSHGIV